VNKIELIYELLLQCEQITNKREKSLEGTKMIGLYLLIPTLLTIFLSYLVVRAGAIVLMMPGMDQQKARFQALSAFSRAGFTTRETEAVPEEILPSETNNLEHSGH